MKIVLLGSGNVATVLGLRLQQAGHELMQVYSRNGVHAAALASLLNCPAISDLDLLCPAELYLLAVSDLAVAEIAAVIRPSTGMVVHTAGAVNKFVLEECADEYGVMYPLQSILKNRPPSLELPLLVDANSRSSRQKIFSLARTISETVVEVSDSDRLKLHLAAVMVNNFSNHLYALAYKFCVTEHLQFELLNPLIQETAGRLSGSDPASLQTGPAARNDLQTIESHLQLLENYPQLKNIYRLITASIQARSSDIY